eukprot:173000-Lingulodinium_polyedra.AAC.1
MIFPIAVGIYCAIVFKRLFCRFPPFHLVCSGFGLGVACGLLTARGMRMRRAARGVWHIARSIWCLDH